MILCDIIMYVIVAPFPHGIWVVLWLKLWLFLHRQECLEETISLHVFKSRIAGSYCRHRLGFHRNSPFFKSHCTIRHFYIGDTFMEKAYFQPSVPMGPTSMNLSNCRPRTPREKRIYTEHVETSKCSHSPSNVIYQPFTWCLPNQVL